MKTPDSPNNDVTQLLIDWRKGNQAVLDQLLPLIYQELHKIAGGYMRNERPGLRSNRPR